MAVDVVTPSAAARPRVGLQGLALVRRLDFVLLAATAALAVFGLWAIGGITRSDASSTDYYVVRQGVFVAVGAVLMLGLLFVDPETFRRS